MVIPARWGEKWPQFQSVVKMMRCPQLANFKQSLSPLRNTCRKLVSNRVSQGQRPVGWIERQGKEPTFATRRTRCNEWRRWHIADVRWLFSICFWSDPMSVSNFWSHDLHVYELLSLYCFTACLWLSVSLSGLIHVWKERSLCVVLSVWVSRCFDLDRCEHWLDISRIVSSSHLVTKGVHGFLMSHVAFRFFFRARDWSGQGLVLWIKNLIRSASSLSGGSDERLAEILGECSVVPCWKSWARSVGGI